MIADLGIALLGAGQQPLPKLHQGVVVGRVSGMLLQFNMKTNIHTQYHTQYLQYSCWEITKSEHFEF